MIRESIVIACHNGQEYLAETIASALAVMDEGCEVVLVNDGSTDHTLEIMRHYEGDRVQVVNISERVGRSEARNAGIRQAKGSVILINDADDLLSPDRIVSTRKTFKKNPKADVIYGPFNIIDELGNVLGENKAEPFDIEKVKTTGFTGIGHSTMAFRRKVFDTVQYDKAYGELGIDDWKFQVDCHKAGFRFFPLKERLMSYRYLPKERDESKIAEMKKAALA